MRARTQLAIDRWVGLPLAWVANLAARLLGKLMRRDHDLNTEKVRTVVVAKYLGMGSIVQATPLLRSIRSRFPDARLIFLTGRNCRALVERIEGISEIITIDDSSLASVLASSGRAVLALMRARVDIYFDLEVYSAYASIMALVSLARNRAGFFRDSAGHKRGNYTHLVYFNTHRPIRTVYMQLGRIAGCRPVSPNILGPLRIDDEDRREANALLESHGIQPGNYILVNPNASDLLLERRWPADRYVELIEQIAGFEECVVAVIGSRSEKQYVSALVENVSVPKRRYVSDLSGESSLGVLLALLESSRCLITNDSGPMHFAWALDRPTISLFGPASPLHYLWQRPNNRVFYRPVYCSPCVHEIDTPPCKGDNTCMKKIEVSDVVAAVKDILTGPVVCPAIEHDLTAYTDDNGNVLGQVTRSTNL